MAIRVEETGLTQVAYDEQMAAYEDPVWKITVERLNLDFSLRGDGSGRGNDPEWDVVAVPDFNYVAHAYGGNIYFEPKEVAGTVPQSIPTGLTFNQPPSLHYDQTTNTLSIYVITGSGANITRQQYILYQSYTAFAGSTTLQTGTLNGNESFVFIAGTASDRCHAVVRDSAKALDRLTVHTTTSHQFSRVRLQYPVDSFAAAHIDGVDVVTLVTNTPSHSSLKAVGDQIYRYLEHAGGILSWIYTPNVGWSDHYEVDVLDNLNESRVRKSVRMAYTNDRLTAVAFSATGEEPYVYSTYRLYTSKDGKYWSFGQVIPMDTVASDQGLKIVSLGDTAIMADFGGIYTSQSTDMIGYCAEADRLDVSDHVAECSISNNKSKVVQVTLENEDGRFENHAILNENNIIQVRVHAGYRTAENPDGYFQLVTKAEIDAMEKVVEADNRILSLNGRDYMGWLTDKFASENAEYWESQMIGADNYTDTTTSKYGGLSHSAVQEGGWFTGNQQLELKSNNEEGIVFNTHDPYIWNGSWESSFTMASANNGEYAGLVFRALDKDNLWMVVYDQATDQIALKIRRGGTDTTLAETGTLGWSSDLTQKHLRVEFYYAEIKAYYSETDRTAWQPAFTYIADGIDPDGDDSSSLLLDRGYVGHIAKGYHEEVEWALPDWTFPDLAFEPFDWTLDGLGFTMPQLLSGDDTPDEVDEPGLSWIGRVVNTNAPETSPAPAPPAPPYYEKLSVPLTGEQVQTSSPVPGGTHYIVTLEGYGNLDSGAGYETFTRNAGDAQTDPAVGVSSAYNNNPTFVPTQYAQYYDGATWARWVHLYTSMTLPEPWRLQQVDFRGWFQVGAIDGSWGSNSGVYIIYANGYDLQGDPVSIGTGYIACNPGNEGSWTTYVWTPDHDPTWLFTSVHAQLRFSQSANPSTDQPVTVRIGDITASRDATPDIIDGDSFHKINRTTDVKTEYGADKGLFRNGAKIPFASALPYGYAENNTYYITPAGTNTNWTFQYVDPDGEPNDNTGSIDVTIQEIPGDIDVII